MDWLPRNQTDWSGYTTVGHFIEEIDKNPGLRRKSAVDLKRDTKSGGSAFYAALGNFCRMKANGDEKKREELMRSVIPLATKYPKYDFGAGPVRFDSKPERAIAILLNKYGLLKTPEEGKNLHVPTNGKSRHNINFLVGNTLIEYHPIQFSEKTTGRTFEDVFNKRWENITNPDYQQHLFWMIQDIDSLYAVLQDSEVNPLMCKRYQDMTEEQFTEDINWAYKKAADHDHKQKIKRQKAELDSILRFSYDFLEEIYPTRENQAANSNKELTKKAA